VSEKLAVISLGSLFTQNQMGRLHTFCWLVLLSCAFKYLVVG
jgi:hypothetical protein